MRSLPPIIFFALAAGITLAAATCTGPSHGAAFSACWLAWLMGATAVPQRSRDAAPLVVAVALGVMVGPLSAWLSGRVDLSLAAGNALIACACALAAGGIVAGLAAVRCSPAIAAVLVVVLGAAWFGWPIWASPYLAGREELVSSLSWCHPLLSADAAIVRAGSIPWSEHTLMYRKLTVLQQHVFPRPPTTIWPAIVVHGLIGVLGLAADWFKHQKQPTPVAAQGNAGREVGRVVG